MELMSGIHQAVEEIVARRPFIHLLVEERLQTACADAGRRSGKDNALTFLDIHLKVTRYVEVLIRRISSLLFLRILHPPVPVGLEDELVLLTELHVQIRIAGIHTSLDAVVHRLIVATGHGILMRELSHATECKERTEAKRSSRMCILQRITDQDPVLIMLEHHFLFQDYTTNTINGGRYFVTIKFPDVLMSFRTVVVALILMESQIEFSTMLNNGNIE